MTEDDDPRQQAPQDAPQAPPVEQEAPEPDEQDEPEQGAAETTESEGDGQPPPSEAPQRQRSGTSGLDRLKRQNERLQRELNEVRARTGGTRIEDVDAAITRIVGPPPKEEDFR